MIKLFLKNFSKSKIILLFITLVFLLITAKAYQASSLSFHFVDEDNNLALGKYLLKGETLYEDMYSQHQPLGYIFSAKVQEITSPNSLFLLIKRHRKAIIVWSAFWSLLLVARFGFPLLIFVFFYELLKYFLLGHLFLSESLAVYPFAYIAGWVFSKSQPSKWETIFLGICLSVSFLLLSPLWPVLIFLLIYILRSAGLWIGNLGIVGLLAGGILPLVFALNYFSIIDYFHDVFYINLKYFVPQNAEPLAKVLPKAFFTPLISLFSWEGRSATLQVIQVLSLTLFLSWLVLLWKKIWKPVLLMFTILGLSNLRYIVPGQQSYSGFHIIPWFAVFILAVAFSSRLAWKNFPLKAFKVLVVVLFLGAFWITFRESKDGLFLKKDMAKDAYIFYSVQAAIGEGIKIMKGPNEKLMVIPDEWLIYWQADIDHAYETLDYYAWWANVPEIRDPLEKMFDQSPPEFFYCDKCQRGYLGLEKFFPKYQYIKKDGSQTKLMVLKDKLNSLSQKQKDKLGYYNFDVE